MNRRPGGLLVVDCARVPPFTLPSRLRSGAGLDDLLTVVPVTRSKSPHNG
ncbi:hypothetical protein [Streptomyces sp. NPDC056921]